MIMLNRQQVIVQIIRVVCFDSVRLCGCEQLPFFPVGINGLFPIRHGLRHQQPGSDIVTPASHITIRAQGGRKTHLLLRHTPGMKSGHAIGFVLLKTHRLNRRSKLSRQSPENSRKATSPHKLFTHKSSCTYNTHSGTSRNSKSLTIFHSLSINLN